MNTSFDQILRNLGLTGDQSEVYLSLLTSGPQKAAELAASTSIKRTNIYPVTKQLMKLRLVTETTIGKKLVYRAEQPENLLNLSYKQKLTIEHHQQSLISILPKLNTYFSVSEIKPAIRYLEGLDGIKETYLDTIAVGKPILALVQVASVHPEIYTWVTTEYVRLRVKHRIPVQAIVSSQKSAGYIERNATELRETRIASAGSYPLDHEVNIYGDKVAIIENNAKSRLLGIIIHNPFIANTFRSWFRMTWDALPAN